MLRHPKISMFAANLSQLLLLPQNQFNPKLLRPETLLFQRDRISQTKLASECKFIPNIGRKRKWKLALMYHIEAAAN